jgi:hypothetical protein
MDVSDQHLAKAKRVKENGNFILGEQCQGMIPTLVL